MFIRSAVILVFSVVFFCLLFSFRFVSCCLAFRCYVVISFVTWCLVFFNPCVRYMFFDCLFFSVFFVQCHVFVAVCFCC